LLLLLLLRNLEVFAQIRVQQYKTFEASHTRMRERTEAAHYPAAK
jgi:hypothetical protein